MNRCIYCGYTFEATDWNQCDECWGLECEEVKK